MDSQYKRQQALHHQAALHKLHTQLQTPFASTSSMQSSPVSPTTFTPAVLMPPVPALDSSYPPASSSNQGSSTNSASSGILSCLQSPKATAPHLFLSSSYGSGSSSYPTHCDGTNAGGYVPHAEPIVGGQRGYGSLANITQMHPHSMDTMHATGMWAACQPETSYHSINTSQVYGYNPGFEAKFGGADLYHLGGGMGLLQPNYSVSPQLGLPYNPLAGTSFYPRASVDSVPPLNVFSNPGWSNDAIYDSPNDNDSNNLMFGSPLEQISPTASTSTPCDRPHSANSATGSPVPVTLVTSHAARQRRRRSEGDSKPKPRRGSINNRSHMSQEEKAYRAAATIGLPKEEKRKVQNKLAQRAFRERSKNKNRAVADRLSQLEAINEAQDGGNRQRAGDYSDHTGGFGN